MASSYTQLQTNIGVLGVGAVAEYYAPMGYNRLQVAFDSKPSTVYDLSGIYAKLDALADNPNWNLIYDMQRGAMTKADYENVYKSEIDNINDHISWVYGDIYSGGFGFCRFVGGGASPIISYGVATKKDNDNNEWYWFRSFFLEGNADYNIFKNQCKSFFLAYCKVYESGTPLQEPRCVDWYPSEQTGRRIGLFYNEFWETNPITYGYERTASFKDASIPPLYSWTTSNIPDGNLADVLDNSVMGTTIAYNPENNIPFNQDIVMTKYFWCRNPYNGTASYINEYDYIEGWEFPKGGWTGGALVPDDPNNNNGGNPDQGGGGDYDDDDSTGNTPNDLPDFAVDATDTGFVNLYNPSKSELKALATFLFTGITESISIVLKRLVANPLDYIVSLNLCHASIPSNETEMISFGGVPTNVVMNKISNQFLKLYGGSLTINEQKQARNFLDYNMRCIVWIPYCGTAELPIDWVMNATLDLRYVVDLLTGSLTATIYSTRERLSYLHGVEKSYSELQTFTFSGNCFEPLPIACADYRNVVNGALGLAGGIATSIATGNPLPAVGSLSNAVMNSKPHIQTGGNMAGCYGYMTQQRAFIMLSRNVPNVPLGWGSWAGYPCNQIAKLETFTGYTEVQPRDTWANDFSKPITDTELDELRDILQNGIYV